MSLQDPPYKIVLERSATFQHYYLIHVYPPAPLTVTVLNMNGAKTDERNYYAESYIALIEAIIKETASIIKDIKKAMGEV